MGAAWYCGLGRLERFRRTIGFDTVWRWSKHSDQLGRHLFSGGVHYRPTKAWLLQAGVTYDTSPVGASDRSAYLPMDRQVRVAFGAQYQLNERMNIGGAFEYIDLGDARIDDPNLLIGEYDENRVFMFAVNLDYKF